MAEVNKFLYLENKYPYYFPSAWNSSDEIRTLGRGKAYSVIYQTFVLLKLNGHNAYEKADFKQTAFVSCSPMESKVQQNVAHALSCYSLSDICPEPFINFLTVKGDWNALDTSIKDAMVLLQRYLSEFDMIHKGCMKKMTEGSVTPSESEVQAVLACHLFGQLASNSKILIDQNSNNNKGCPWCSLKPANIYNEDTSFGHGQYWHGRGDIVIVHREDKSTNIVSVTSGAMDIDGYSVESETSADLDENGSVEVKQVIPSNYSGLSSMTNLRNQVLSQTITNGFLVCKENKSLEDNFIPCFLASCSHVAINMYNPKSDVLLTQGDYMTIITKDGQLNEEMVFQMWLALNLNLFKQNVPKALQCNEFKPCGFVSTLSEEVQNIYKYHLTSVPELQAKHYSYPTKLVVDQDRSWKQLLNKLAEETGT